VSWIGETRGLAAVDSLSEGAMEEGILYIELLNWPIMGDSSGEHHAHGGMFHNRAESLIVVDSRALSETLKDPASLVAIEGPVSADGGRDQGWCRRRSRGGEDESIRWHSEAILRLCDHPVRILQRRDRHHHALTSCRRWPKRGWWSGTRGGGLPWTTDIGDG
jgi:hypothetical protein